VPTETTAAVTTPATPTESGAPGAPAATAAPEGERVIGLQEALRLIGHGWISEADTESLSDADKSLYADQEQINDEERAKLMEIIRNAIKSNTVQIGEITANITLNMTYPRYLEFLKYINTLKRATIVTNVKQNLIAEPGNYPRDYEISLALIVVREMDMPEIFKNTPELNEAVEDEAAKADEEMAAADKTAADEVKKNQEKLDEEGKVITDASNRPPETAASQSQTFVDTEPPPLVVTNSDTEAEVTEAPVPRTAA
jgi:hypothetical protein